MSLKKKKEKKGVSAPLKTQQPESCGYTPSTETCEPTHPKDEIEEEEQILHAFHPALHFTHDALWSAAAHDPNRFEYLPPRCYHCIVIVIIILSVLAAGGRAPCIVHVLCCPATSKHAHKAAARRPLFAPPLSCRVHVAPRYPSSCVLVVVVVVGVSHRAGERTLHPAALLEMGSAAYMGFYT